MFRDREKALEELEKQLLEDEEEKAQEECEQDEEAEELPPRRPFDFDAYNTDHTDTDLEDYSQEVYNPRRKTGCAFWLLVIASLVLGIAWFLAKREGLL